MTDSIPLEGQGTSSHHSLVEENRMLKEELVEARKELTLLRQALHDRPASFCPRCQEEKQSSDEEVGQKSTDNQHHVQHGPQHPNTSSKPSPSVSLSIFYRATYPLPVEKTEILTPAPTATDVLHVVEEEEDVEESEISISDTQRSICPTLVGTIKVVPSREEDAEESEVSITDTQRAICPTVGAIKALPRECSIRHAADDEVSKHSFCSSKAMYEVVKTDVVDANRARGLYTGSISSMTHMPHGWGRMNYHLQGRSYEGEWRMGQWHGHGTTRYPQGHVYRGQFINNLRNGVGTLHYADGRVFQGTFCQDDPVEGSLAFPNGARYEGALHNGSRHGYGVYYFKDGSVYEGYSETNMFHGKGKMTWNDGGWYQGDWLYGVIQGYGKEIRADGSLRHEGQWVKGVPIRPKT